MFSKNGEEATNEEQKHSVEFTQEQLHIGLAIATMHVIRMREAQKMHEQAGNALLMKMSEEAIDEAIEMGYIFVNKLEELAKHDK